MRMLSRISAYFYSLLDFRSRLKYLSHNNETNQWTTPIRNKSPRVSSIFVKYLTFLLLLLCSKTATYSIDAENCRNEYFPSAFESWSIHLLAPIDQAAFGGSLYFAFHLTHHNFIAMDADSPFDDNRYSGSENQSVEIRRLTSEPKVIQ